MTKIVSAALLFTLNDKPNVTLVISGGSHAELYRLLDELEIDYGSTIEGFMTSTDRFVDRYEARRLAIQASQLVTEICSHNI